VSVVVPVARRLFGPLPTAVAIALLVAAGAVIVLSGASSTPWWALAGLAGGYAISGSV